MANASSVLDFTMRRADWLAQAVSDGDWSNVLVDLKVDDTPAAASDITTNAGQLWANAVDDMFVYLLQFHSKGTKVWRRVSTAARDLLGSDDNLAANDLCWVEATNTLYYCVSVDGTDSSTWSAVAGGGGSSTFTGLSDTPGAYASQQNKLTRVNSGQTALEFIAGSSAPTGSVLVFDSSKGTFLGEGNVGNWPTLTGQRNVGIGNITVDALTTGSFNVAVGDAAGSALTTGQGNVFIGDVCAPACAAYNDVVAIGRAALTAATSTSIALGSQGTVAIGTRALASGIWDDGNNVAVGFEAGHQLASAAEETASAANVAVGYRALRGQNNLSPGAANCVAVGYLALEDADGANFNVAVGSNSGLNVTTGDDNILLGGNTAASLTTGSNNIIVGSGIDVPAADSTQHLQIGNLIFGHLSTLNMRVGGFGAVTGISEKLLVQNGTADTTPVTAIQTTGTNGAKSRTYVGTRDPRSTVTGAIGDLYVRVNGNSSQLFICLGGTTWDTVVSGVGGTLRGPLGVTPNPITFSAAITVDTSLSNDHVVGVTTTDFTIAFSNPVAGRSGRVTIPQGATPRSITAITVASGTWTVRMLQGDGTTLNTSKWLTANARGILSYWFVTVNSVNILYVSMSGDAAIAY